MFVKQLIALFGWEYQGNDEAVQTQHFRKDQYENHPHKEPRLLRSTSHACVAHYAYSKAGGQATEAHGETRSQMEEGPVCGSM